MVSQQEVMFAIDRDVPIIDIRPPADFEAGHIKGYVLLQTDPSIST